MNKLKVTGLELTTKEGKKVALTLEEAKELHSQLDELFGQKPVPYIPYQPIVVDRYWWNPHYNVTSGESTISIESSSGLQTVYNVEARS